VPGDLEEAIYQKESNYVKESKDHKEAFDLEEFIDREASIDLVESNYLKDSSNLNDSQMCIDQITSTLSMKLIGKEHQKRAEKLRDKTKSILNLMLAINVHDKHRKELWTILNKTSQGHLAVYLNDQECKLLF